MIDKKWQMVLSIAVPILSAIIMNIAIYTTSVGANRNQRASSLLPPGWVIGMIWIFLFGLLGYIFYLYKNNAWIATSIIVFFLYCLMYPLYTRGLNAKSRVAKLANLGTLILAFGLTIAIARTSGKNVLYMIPILLWASYVNVLDVLECAKTMK